MTTTPGSRTPLLGLAAALLASSIATADENVFGYVKGAETMPEGSWELYQWMTYRGDKGQGSYRALDVKTEFERAFTDRFNASVGLKGQSVRTEGLIINGYLPKEESSGLEFSGVEASMKYNFLKPALHPIGLSAYMSFDYDRLDSHSGQGKDKKSLELHFLFQKYALDGQLIWVGNVGYEATHADRDAIDDLPEEIEWPTEAEVELELIGGTGLAYRFAPSWFAGIEALYETEFETEVNQERWSVFAGPTLHYGAKAWWATLTWFPQIRGGGEQYDGQRDTDLHLIEKTKSEIRLKVGFNF